MRVLRRTLLEAHMKCRSGVVLSVVIAVLGLTLSGCGSSPTSPSSTNTGVTLHGLALGQGAASTSSASGYRAMSTRGSATVTVQENPPITTTIPAHGPFALEERPPSPSTPLSTR